MSVLLIADISGGTLSNDSTSKALSAVKSLGPVTLLVAGEAVSAAAVEAATLDGVANVLLAESALYSHTLAEPLADLIVSLAPNFSHIVAPATTSAKNVMPRISALMDVMVIPEVTKVLSADTFERPIYAGTAVQTVQSIDKVKVLTIRTAAFSLSERQSPAEIQVIDAVETRAISFWRSEEVTISERPELTSAQVVVSGGRGVGSQESFGMIEALADKLGGAVGASRAAVDLGYAPNDSQVGQTGKVVAPKLYIAIGISGAIQHLAGMKDSDVIIAINKDEDAPIFQICDYGYVGDLFSVVPELTAKI